MKEYENRQWVIGEKNQFGNECYKLYFTQFYNKEFVIGFVKDEDDDSYLVSSPMLNIEQDYIFATDIDDAKEQCEEMIESHILEQIDFYNDMLQKFKEMK